MAKRCFSHLNSQLLLVEFSMNNSDKKNAELVRKSIEDVRSVLLDKAIRDLKIVHILSTIKLSKSKFFNFFGSINTVLEMVITEELISCYSLILDDICSIQRKQLVLVEVNQLRTIYFRNNPILFDYYSNAIKLPFRYKALKEAVSNKERELYFTTLEKSVGKLNYDHAWTNPLKMFHRD